MSGVLPRESIGRQIAKPSMDFSLHGHDFEQAIELAEVIGVACVQGQFRGERGRGDQQIKRPPTLRLATRLNNRAVNPAVGAGDCSVDMDGVERRLGPLESVLPTCALCRIGRCVRSSCELRKGCSGYRDLVGEVGRIDPFQVDDN